MMTSVTVLSHTSRQRRQRGFTILELLVAFAIMAISLGMLYRASGGSARSVGNMERYQRATVLAESILAMRDAVPEEGWSEAGQVAGFDWRVAINAASLKRSKNPNKGLLALRAGVLLDASCCN